ncbi:MAG: hypothetical protein NT023_04860, partial [Armatimonadetes bacterium]|nr:hypothetical protein [Armatimonadota bacterium]
MRQRQEPKTRGTTPKTTPPDEISSHPLAKVLPFVWPEPCALESIKPLDCSKNDKEIALMAQSVFGVLSGLNLGGVNYLKSLLEANRSLQCRLLVVLHPACVTSKSVLTELESVMNANAETAVFRLFVVHSIKESPSNALCYLAEAMPPVFTIGGSHNLGSDEIVAQPNFTFYGDGALVDSWSNWFNWAWSKSVRLDSETASIPPFMVVQLTGEEERLWQNYMLGCHMIPADSPSLEAEVNEHTGKVEYYNSAGVPVATPTEELGCKTLDANVSELVSILQALYRRGALMTIDKTTRLKPFDTPINPRWFGMDSLRT